MPILIRGGTVVNHDFSERADVLVDGGQIAEVGPRIDPPTGTTVVEADGCYVMPGGIDPHTHLEMPFMGTTTAETWESGTLAALVGGTTMIVDMCLPAPGQSLLAAYQDWRRKAERAACDHAFHMSITWWDRSVFDDMEACVRTYGINTFKHFMAYKGSLMVNDEEMYQSFARCANLGALPLVHAENGDVVLHLQRHCLSTGHTGPEAHSFSRPTQVEAEATSRAIMIADMAGCPVYIVHTSCRDAHEAIARARAAGQRVYGEPLIQHLVLDDGVYANPDWDFAAQRVMSPPFRDKHEQDSLWAGLQSGSLQVVATDHCAFTTAQKQMGRGDFTKIPNGTGGLENRLEVLWTAGVRTGRLTKEEFVAVTSANIARILNLFPRKGVIRPGADADIVVFDPEATKTIAAATQMSAIDYNVFEGFECRGVPRATLRGGTLAFIDGDLRAEPGTGAYVERKPFAPVHVADATWRELNGNRPVERFEAVTP